MPIRTGVMRPTTLLSRTSTMPSVAAEEHSEDCDYVVPGWGAGST